MVDLTRFASGEQIHKAWNALSRVPGGKTIFSNIVGNAAPYTGTIGARVLDLAPGYARVQMRDRRAVRNHLDCIHAVALINLAEVTTGLAILCGLNKGARGILRGLEIKYVKKARGTLTAECRCKQPTSNQRRAYAVVGILRNEEGEMVARATAQWQIGPR